MGKIGDSVAQVTVPRRADEQELEEALKSGPIIGEDVDALAEEDVDDEEALIASLERQKLAMKYDYRRTAKKSARYGLQTPEAVQAELESIECEIARIDDEIESLDAEEA